METMDDYTNEYYATTERLEVKLTPRIYSSSIIGTREYQQDRFGFQEKDDVLLAVVCDGMGGLKGGEQASEISVQTLLNDFIETEVAPHSYNDFLFREAKRLDRIVYSLKDASGKRLEAGTTIVSIVIADHFINWLSVGDSKIYFIRDNQIYDMVPQHNYKMTLDNLLNAGKITRQKYQSEIGRGEALISFLGIGNVSVIEVNRHPFRLNEGDMIVLCSDGLYKRLSDEQILAVIQDNYFDCQRAADTLTRTAMEYSNGKSQDNTTVIIATYR